MQALLQKELEAERERRTAAELRLEEDRRARASAKEGWEADREAWLRAKVPEPPSALGSNNGGHV